MSTVDDDAVIASISVVDADDLPVCGSTVESDDQLTFTPNGASSTDGIFEVSFSAVDIYGNLQGHIFSFTVDSLAPAAPSVNPATTPAYKNSQLITGAKEADRSICMNGAEVVALSSNTSWQYTAALFSGTNTLSFVARDRAGNAATSVVPVSVTLSDTQEPEHGRRLPVRNLRLRCRRRRFPGGRPDRGVPCCRAPTRPPWNPTAGMRD